jgi:hypothetical protein
MYEISDVLFGWMVDRCLGRGWQLWVVGRASVGWVRVVSRAVAGRDLYGGRAASGPVLHFGSSGRAFGGLPACVGALRALS